MFGIVKRGTREWGRNPAIQFAFADSEQEIEFPIDSG